MGLRHLMTQCLNKLLTRLKPSLLSEALASPRGYPKALSSDEYAARFIFNDRELFKEGSAKPKAFMPEKGTGIWETSVCRKTGTSENRIWEIARIVRLPMKALARADICIRRVHLQGLWANAAPELGYQEHSVIVDWPEGEDEKARHKAIATVLASESIVVMNPL